VTERALRAVRWLATAPLFKHLTRSQALLRVSFALRGSLMRERLRFALNELRRRSVVRVYRLRESGVAVAVRHHTGDVLVLDEIFSQREYDPPPAAAELLSALPSSPRVVDLGANIGLFGAWVLGRFPEATIAAVEADPANAAVHRRAIAANRLEGRWRLLQAFAATAPGTVRFAAGRHATSHAAADEKDTLEVAAVDVLPELVGADLVKIDIEGAEWDLLSDPRFTETPPRVIVLEYHQQGCPGDDPLAAAEQALRAAGLKVVAAGHKPRFGAGVVWGLAPEPSAGEAGDPPRA
jgi:FkbM family methyltransferase